MRYVFIVFFLLVFKVNAFIPPVSSVLKEIFDSRKFGDGLELIFVHQVANSNGEWLEIEERILSDRRGIKFIWKPALASTWVSGSLDKRTYFVGNDKRINSRSLLFLKNFISSSAIEFRDALINEKFLRWEQLKQFKDEFEPQGDPQTWDVKSNYLAHDSISLVLLAIGPTIAIVGSQDPNSKRTIYLDKGLLGVKKIEWLEEGKNLSWNFDQLTLNLKDSFFSRRSALNLDGKDIIQSELVAIRPLNKRQIADWGQLWQKASKSLVNAPVAEEALRILLSSR